MKFNILVLLLSGMLKNVSSPVKPPAKIDRNTLDSIAIVVSQEFNREPETDYDRIAEAMSDLSREQIISLLYRNRLLGGEHAYNASKLWALYESALTYGTHTSLAMCLRSTNKFQASLDAKMRVKNDIVRYLAAGNHTLPGWINFDDLMILEDQRLGISNPNIDAYFRAMNIRLTDDTPWCAAYAGAKLKDYDPDFVLPRYPLAAASYGGFGNSSFSYATLRSNSRTLNGRYPSVEGLDYLPAGIADRYEYTIDDFKDKNRVPFGALVVFKRNGGGHVGFVVGTMKDVFSVEMEDGTIKEVSREGIVVLGGNQNDAVQFEVFYDLSMIRAVTLPSKYPKEFHFTIPELPNRYDIPECYSRNTLN